MIFGVSPVRLPGVCAWEGTHLSWQMLWQLCALSNWCSRLVSTWVTLEVLFLVKGKTLKITSIETFPEIKMLDRNKIK